MAASAAPLTIRQKCRFCSHWRHPADFLVNSTVGPCNKCAEYHRHAIGVLAGNPPPGCQECGLTFAQLADAGGETRMYLHPKDGIFQILCRRCSDEYERKRLDLYARTPYGRKRGLS